VAALRPGPPRRKITTYGWSIRVPSVLGDGPAVLPRQVGQQPENELVGTVAGLHPANRPAIRPRSRSASAAHLSGSTLWPTATAQSLAFDTTDENHAVAAQRRGTATPGDHDQRLEY
jgi:hypothetical protein